MEIILIEVKQVSSYVLNQQPQKTVVGASYPSCAAYDSIKPLPVMLLSRPKVGEQRNTIAPSVNTLAVHKTVTTPRSPEKVLVTVLLFNREGIVALVKKGNRGGNAVGVAILLCLWGFAMIIFFKDEPAPIDERGSFQQQRIFIEQKEAKADELLDRVKAYEAFLSQAESEFKSTKASDKGLDNIRKTLALFDGTAESLNEARIGKDRLSKEDVAYLEGIEKRLSTLQQKVLPGLRLAFRKRSAELLWERDVSVSVSGPRNTEITFTAGMFSTNANIKAVQLKIEGVVTHLRFKKTRFQWHKNADKLTQYKIKTPPDAKISMFKFGQFVSVPGDDKK